MCDSRYLTARDSVLQHCDSRYLTVCDSHYLMVRDSRRLLVSWLPGQRF